MVTAVLALLAAPVAAAAPPADARAEVPVAPTTVDALDAELDYLIDGVGLGEPPVAPPLHALTEVPPPETVARWMALRAAEAVDQGRNPVDWLRTAQRLDPDLDLGPLAPSALHPLRVDWEAVAVQPALDGPRVRNPAGVPAWVDGLPLQRDMPVGAGAHVVQHQVDGRLRTVVVDGPDRITERITPEGPPCLIRVKGRCEARWFVGASLGAGVLGPTLVEPFPPTGRTDGGYAFADAAVHLGLAVRLDDEGAWLGLGPLLSSELVRSDAEAPQVLIGGQGRLRAGRYGAVLGGWIDVYAGRPGGHALASLWPLDEAPMALDAGVIARVDGAVGLRVQLSVQHPRFLE